MTTRSSLTLPALLLTLTVASGLTACSSSSKLPTPPGSSGSALGADSYQQVIDDAPVAAASDVPAAV